LDYIDHIPGGGDKKVSSELTGTQEFRLLLMFRSKLNKNLCHESETVMWS